MESVIFIESNTSGTGEIFIKKVIEYNCKPIFLTSNANLYTFLNRLPQVEVVEINTLKKCNIIDFCNSYIKDGNIIKGVTSTSEYYIEMAAKVAAHFKLPGANASAIATCRNKYSQYETLLRNGLKLPKTEVINKLKNFEKRVSGMDFPIIVKPIEGTGSVGVRLCKSYNECYNLVSQLLLCKRNERGIEVDNRVLIEEYIEGEEYSGEVFNGNLIGVTKKHLSDLPFFVETGHDFPAKLDKNQYNIIESSIVKAVSVLGLKWGACHVEFRFLNNTVFFIEVNPRLAGGFIPEIVKKSTGIDLIENQLNASLGLPIRLDKTNNAHVGIRFVIPSGEGFLTGFKNKIDQKGILEIKEYKTKGRFYKKNGDFRDRIGHIIFDMDIITPKKIESEIRNLAILDEEKV